MHTNSKTAVFAGLFLMTLAGAADAGERRGSHSPYNQSRGMHERLHQRDGRDEWRHGDRDGRHGHSDRRDHRDRHLYYGHERRRDGAHGRGRGYWHDYHHGHGHGHHRGYRHRFHNNYHYYYNAGGFYFPGYGVIAHGHRHDRHCPHWHFEDFASGFVLGAIIAD